MGCERDGYVRQANTRDLVAISIDCREQRGECLANGWGHFLDLLNVISQSVVPPVRNGNPVRTMRLWDTVENLLDQFERNRRAVVDPSMAVGRRLDAIGDPSVQIEQARPQKRRVVDHVADVLRTAYPFDALSSISGRPYPDAMLRACEMINPCIGRDINVSISIRISVY